MGKYLRKNAPEGERKMKWHFTDIRMKSLTDYTAAFHALTPEKRARVDKIRQKKDKMRTVFADALARELLSEALGCAPDALEFTFGEYGKPLLKGGEYFFNVSHCEDIVVAAVDDSPVGIDVERIREISPYIAKKYFCHNEQVYLFGHVPRDADFERVLSPEARMRFFELWTAKEAYLKCRGTGMTHVKTVDTTLLSFERHLLSEDYLVTIYKE